MTKTRCRYSKITTKLTQLYSSKQFTHSGKELKAGSKPSCHSECQQHKPDVRFVLTSKPSSWAELAQLQGDLKEALCVCNMSACLLLPGSLEAAAEPGQQ